jgi:hypothetical protein
METVSVLCLAMPDGSAFWIEEGAHDVGQAIANWKARLSPEKRAVYDQAGVCGGFVRLRMLREDYLSIPATSASAALFAPRVT